MGVLSVAGSTDKCSLQESANYALVIL